MFVRRKLTKKSVGGEESSGLEPGSDDLVDWGVGAEAGFVILSCRIVNENNGGQSSKKQELGKKFTA